MTRLATQSKLSERIGQFIKFCVVGGGGVLVDMVVLYFLADKAMLGWNVTLVKICSAEMAMLNNFLWNELWTFRREAGGQAGGVVARLLRFHAICGMLASKQTMLFTFLIVISFNIANLFIVLSIENKNATLAGLVEISYPLFIALFSWLLFKDVDVNPWTALGGALVLAGVGLIYVFNK